MDFKLYEQYKLEYLTEAINNTDRSIAALTLYLDEAGLPGRFARHREERMRALKDVRQAFDEHRHWPLDILLSYLGVDSKQFPKP